MEACLERIAAREPVIHAFAHHQPDAARAAVPAANLWPPFRYQKYDRQTVVAKFATTRNIDAR